MVNATKMAKAFGKLPKDWFKTEQSKRLIEAISGRKNILPTDLLNVISTLSTVKKLYSENLLRVIKGEITLRF